MWRAGISLILVVSMAFAFSVYLGMFKIRQYSIRQDVKNLIKNGAPDSLKYDFYLDELESDPAGVTWIHSKEFRYKGEMYDILDQSTVNGRVLLHCIHDVKESGLFAELDRMVNFQLSANSHQHHHQNQLLKWFHNLYLLTLRDLRFQKPDNLDSTFPVYLFFTLEFHFTPPTPPPKQLV